MNKFPFAWFIFFFYFFGPQTSLAFLLPAETILENNVSTRKYLKRIFVTHKIDFLEGFYTPISFRCVETIYFKNNSTIRFDYLCNGVSLTLLRTGRNGKERKMIYNKKVESLDAAPLHFWPALFFTTDMESLIPSLTHAELIEAEREESEEENKNTKEKAPQTAQWKISASVSLTKLGKIERAAPEKLEKNLILLLSPFGDSSKKIFFEKDLFLPQKIEYDGREILFKNYRELTFSSRLIFKYPQKIEVQESGIPGISLESSFEKIDTSTNYADNFFSPKIIAGHEMKAFDDPIHKEVLDKFVREYR
ncbi:MAG: hypothetical protein AAB309_05955 [Deltaproteobacteria bacterium]